MLVRFFLILSISWLMGCSGLKKTEDTFAVHAESFNILFLQIPGNAPERAQALVPEGATIKTIHSAPTDVSSFLGFLNRLIGIDYNAINGTLEKK